MGGTHSVADEKQLQLCLLHGDFVLAGKVAFALNNAPMGKYQAGREECDLLWDVLYFSESTHRLSRSDMIDAVALKMIRTLDSSTDGRVGDQTSEPAAAVRSAWTAVLQNMKAFHRDVSKKILSGVRATKAFEQSWWNDRLRTRHISDALPEIQAYYAVRVARHFGVDPTPQLLSASLRLYRQVPTDADLYVEDAEERRKSLVTLVRAVGKLGRRSERIVAEFAVPVSINGYFIRLLKTCL